MSTTTFQVIGMTCAHCEAAVKSEVSELAGVSDVQVSAQTGVLIISSEAALDDAEVLAAVDEAGYTASRVS